MKTGSENSENLLTSSHSEQSNDSLQLSENVCMLPKKPLGKNMFVYEGQFINRVLGNKKIAVKFIPYDDRNVKEAKALLKLTSHKHVVAFIHSDIYDSGPIKYIFIAMEMCHTESLYEHITKSTYKPQFDSRLKFTWTSQLVDGMAHIHNNKIIHRDLKPHNVLFSSDKKLIKIVDFGLSKEISDDQSETNQSTSRVGTDGYRAPETYNGNIISPQADIFSLGIVIYFVWSDGRHPFGDERDLWNYNIKHNKDPSLDGLRILAQDRAKILIRQMLQSEPKKRPTASTLLKHDFFLNQTGTNVSQSPCSGEQDPPLQLNGNDGAGTTALNGSSTSAKRKVTDHPGYSATSTGLSEPKVRHTENDGASATGHTCAVQEMNKFLYTITNSINYVNWLRFARTELGLLDGDIDNIQNDEDGVEEKKIKMLKLWMKQNPKPVAEQQKQLEKLKDQFHRAPKSTADAVTQTGTVGSSLPPAT